MNLKSRVANQVASAVNELEQQVDELPAHLDDAKLALAREARGWSPAGGRKDYI